MSCDLDQVFADAIWLSAFGVCWTMTVAAIMRFGHGFVPELRSIKCRRETVGAFEVAHEVTLVVQANLVRDLFHTEKARL